MHVYNIASTELHFTAPYNPITCDGAAVASLAISLQAVGDLIDCNALQLAYTRKYLDIDGVPLAVCNPVVPTPVEMRMPVIHEYLHRTAAKELYNFIYDCTERMVSELILMDTIDNPDAPTPLCDESRRDYFNATVMQALYNMVQVSPYDCTGVQAVYFYKLARVNYLCDMRAHN